MNYFFIDFENVHSGGFEGIENYSKDDVIYLMYTETCQTVSLRALDKLLKNNVTNFHLIKVAAGGKNALDFQLSTYLGYLIAKTEDQNAGYYIISRDSGFDFIVSFWNGHGIPVKRITNFLPLKPRNNKPANIIPIHTVKTETQEKNNEIIKKENIEKIAAVEENKAIKQNNAKENTEKTVVAEENKTIKQNNTEEKTVAENNKAAEKEKAEEGKSKVTEKPEEENNKVNEKDNAEKKSDAKENKANPKEKKETVKKEIKSEAKNSKPEAVKPKSELNSLKADKKELLKYISSEEYSDRILEIINKYKTKVSIKNNFDKEYRNSKVSGALYQKVRPYLKTIGKT